MKKVVVLGLVLVMSLAVISVAVAYPNRSVGVSGPFELERPVDLPTGFTPVKKQVIAEGCVEYGFETWLLLYNSGDAPSDVVVMLSSYNEYYVSLPFTMKPHQRQTYFPEVMFFLNKVNGISSPDISLTIYSTTSGVVAQESMYWNERKSGHTTQAVVVEQVDSVYGKSVK